MKTAEVKVFADTVEAKLPAYASEGAGAFDLRALYFVTGQERDLEWDQVILIPGETATFDTGLAFEIPEGHVLKVYSRSGHGFNYNVVLANGTGIIDSDYRGNVMVKLTNPGHSTKPLVINKGERICQAVLTEYVKAEFVQVDVREELSSTERGEGGFGSTGTK